MAAYTAVFNYIRDNLAAHVTPSVIMSNFDADIQTALAYAFPEATIKGYWYEYTNALIKHMRSIGMHGDKCRGHAASCVRMLLVLPLLPAEYLAPGVNAIRKWAQEKQIFTGQLAQVCLYIEQKWLRTIGVDKMSIFGFSHSVYNHTQQFNKDFHSALTTTNPSVWQLLECLTQIATRVFIKCSKRRRTTPKPNKNQQVIDAIIKNATQIWIRTPIHLRNPLQFLQLSSHCISDAIGQTHIDEPYLMRVMDPPSPTPTSNEYDAKPQASTALKAQSSDTIEKRNSDSAHSSIISPVDTCPALVKIKYSNAPPTDSIVRHAPQNVRRATNSSSDPPPLAFYPKNQRDQHKAIIFSATQPPPLVPIQRNFT